MDIEDAKRVTKLWGTGEHGEYCGYCASDFADRCNEVFPEFTWGYQETKRGWEITVEAK